MGWVDRSQHESGAWRDAAYHGDTVEGLTSPTERTHPHARSS